MFPRDRALARPRPCEGETGTKYCALETVQCRASIATMSVSPEGAPSHGAAWKIVLSVVVVTGAVGFLLSRSMKEGAEYYKHVDEVMAAPDAVRSTRLQVHGFVVNDSIEQ